MRLQVDDILFIVSSLKLFSKARKVQYASNFEKQIFTGKFYGRKIEIALSILLSLKIFLTSIIRSIR